MVLTLIRTLMVLCASERRVSSLIGVRKPTAARRDGIVVPKLRCRVVEHVPTPNVTQIVLEKGTA